MKRFTVGTAKGRFRIEAFVQEVGHDIVVSMWGGTRPHVGAIGIATPRPSLKDPKKWSATSSSFTYVGHKEDGVVKMVSELLAGQLKTNVVVTAGIHWDDVTSKDIQAILRLAQKLSEQILNRLKRSK